MVSYFPKTEDHEEYACVRLPAHIGDEDGNSWLPDRKIRIFSNPAEHPDNRGCIGGPGDDDDLGIMEQLNRDFVQMKGDVDKERLIDGRKRKSFSSLSDTDRHIAIEIEAKER